MTLPCAPRPALTGGHARVEPHDLPAALPSPNRPCPPRATRAARACGFALACAVALAGGLAAPAALAGPVVFAPFSGTGNAVVFDASTGEGGWTGTLVQFPDPGVSAPLDLVSVVLFRYDALTRSLSGQFEFTRSSDLGATLTGLVSGTTTDVDVFGQGGQFQLDYTILAGSGDFDAANGLGLSVWDFDPNAAGDNYAESGLLLFAVPEPGTLPLAAGAVLALWGLGRRHRSAARPAAGG